MLLVKVTPVVAVAPLFIIWFGFGAAPKVLIAALITFFPMLVNAVTGLRSVSPAALDVFRALDASPWQTFRLLRVPASLPYVVAALKISVPLSLIGAVSGYVGGWVDNLLMRIMDVLLAFPSLLLAIAIVTVIGPGLLNVSDWAAQNIPDQTPEEYIRTSIINPSAYVVSGFPDGLMPKTFSEIFTEQEINDLVSYVLSLKG